MAVAIRTATRLQDQDDVNVTPGAGVDDYVLTYDHGTGKFVLAVVPAPTGFLLATGATTGATSQAQTFTNGIIGPAWKPASNSTTALQLQNATGAAIVTIDTSNKIAYINGQLAPDRGRGGDNVFVGLNAGNETLTGTNNVGLGPYALNGLTSGLNNFGAGYCAAFYLTTGSNNFALGLLAVAGNIGGSANIGIGNYALRYSTSDANVAIGYQAGYGAGVNYAGQNNAFFGNQAGYSAAGYYNVFIGNQAGYYETGNAKFFLDNDPRASEADGRIKALIYGEFAAAPVNQLVRINGILQDLITDAATNMATTTVKISHNSTGTPAAGFGTRIQFELHSSATTNRQSAALTTSWYEATDATRKGDLIAYVTDAGGEREGWRIRADGSAVAIGLYGVTPVARATTGITAVAFVQGTGNAVNDASTFGGYTIGKIAAALLAIGVLT